MDFATRNPEAIPLEKTDAATVAEALCHVFATGGPVRPRDQFYLKIDGAGGRAATNHPTEDISLPPPNERDD